MHDLNPVLNVDAWFQRTPQEMGSENKRENLSSRFGGLGGGASFGSENKVSPPGIRYETAKKQHPQSN